MALEMRAAMKVKRVSLVFACVGVLKAVLIRIVGLIVIMKTVYVSVHLQLTLAVALRTHALVECASAGMKTCVPGQQTGVVMGLASAGMDFHVMKLPNFACLEPVCAALPRAAMANQQGLFAI